MRENQFFFRKTKEKFYACPCKEKITESFKFSFQHYVENNVEKRRL